jgi:hypothetical protein
MFDHCCMLAQAVRGAVLLLQQLFRSAWPMRVVADVLLGTLAASSPLAASVFVGAAVCISCGASGEHWGQGMYPDYV